MPLTCCLLRQPPCKAGTSQPDSLMHASSVQANVKMGRQPCGQLQGLLPCCLALRCCLGRWPGCAVQHTPIVRLQRLKYWKACRYEPCNRSTRQRALCRGPYPARCVPAPEAGRLQPGQAHVHDPPCQRHPRASSWRAGPPSPAAGGLAHLFVSTGYNHVAPLTLQTHACIQNSSRAKALSPLLPAACRHASWEPCQHRHRQAMIQYLQGAASASTQEAGCRCRPGGGSPLPPHGHQRPSGRPPGSQGCTIFNHRLVNSRGVASRGS